MAMIGRMAGAAIGALFSREQHGDPVKGALIGAATMFVARRLLPVRIAAIGATIAAGYLTKKFAEREIARQDAAAEVPARKRRAPARKSAKSVARPARSHAGADAADRRVPATTRSSKIPASPAPRETETTAPPATL